MVNGPDAAVPRSVLITGPLGSGKTAVAVGAGELLDAAGVPYAVVDLDWLCWAGPGLRGDDLTRLMAENLRAVAGTYRAAGIGTLVLARTVTSAAEVSALRWAVGGAMVALRLSVPDDVRAARLRSRPGGSADVAEAAQMAEPARTHLPAVRNHGRTATDTAAEVLRRLGWLPTR